MALPFAELYNVMGQLRWEVETRWTQPLEQPGRSLPGPKQSWHVMETAATSRKCRQRRGTLSRCSVLNI